jgi:hypothetical protein
MSDAPLRTLAAIDEPLAETEVPSVGRIKIEKGLIPSAFRNIFGCNL